ncbi:MAG TPA: NUDIX domain-containing protein [bacterium]|uniref:RNA pyrophosphohydrolase n=1 Tax=candidate division TA06 bacterium ADurb.Bin417 TaxID=1852828 RepID=A0A1V5MB84_UNCT6|nr:MAG: RNA pyrophosphohydrolase [candidate division TA06 bacterium ADurb.Bin417]HNS49320.1 NUDIX domain-containing protein [bacterium]
MKKTFSAGGVVLNRRNQVLVVNQRGRAWSLPKGHLEPGEEPLAAARREIHEETGLKNLRHLGELGGYRRFRLDAEGGDDTSELKCITLFLFRAREERLAPRDPDNPEARWVAIEAVAGLLTHPRDRKFFQELLPRLTRTKRFAPGPKLYLRKSSRDPKKEKA